MFISSLPFKAELLKRIVYVYDFLLLPIFSWIILVRLSFCAVSTQFLLRSSMLLGCFASGEFFILLDLFSVIWCSWCLLYTWKTFTWLPGHTTLPRFFSYFTGRLLHFICLVFISLTCKLYTAPSVCPWSSCLTVLAFSIGDFILSFIFRFFVHICYDNQKFLSQLQTSFLKSRLISNFFFGISI